MQWLTQSIAIFSKFINVTQLGVRVNTMENMTKDQWTLESYKMGFNWKTNFNVDKYDVMHFGKKAVC